MADSDSTTLSPASLATFSTPRMTSSAQALSSSWKIRSISGDREASARRLPVAVDAQQLDPGAGRGGDVGTAVEHLRNSRSRHPGRTGDLGEGRGLRLCGLRRLHARDRIPTRPHGVGAYRPHRSGNIRQSLRNIRWISAASAALSEETAKSNPGAARAQAASRWPLGGSCPCRPPHRSTLDDVLDDEARDEETARGHGRVLGHEDRGDHSGRDGRMTCSPRRSSSVTS